MIRTDTIAAIATALSDSGIGIIRISGEEAVAVGDRIYRTKSGKRILNQAASHTIHYGFIVGESEDDIVDEVLVSVFLSPNSYTAEDTVEINCHGGILVMNRILELAVAAGARPAEPGEFTKRAFLNGRIDLSRAEAVMDVIHSKNRYALKNSVRQLKGSLSETVHKLRDELIYEIAFIESALDDPEHISLDGYPERLSLKADRITACLKKLLDTADDGRMLKEGIDTVIVGKPNAGKSSLLNILTGEDTAIVTDIAGTTRDILKETVLLGGISLNIIDTAGIRPTKDTVEKIGVEKAKEYAADADLIVYVVDASMPLDESDDEIIRMTLSKNMIILLNKTDLTVEVTEDILKNKLEEIRRKAETIPEQKKNAFSYLIRTSTKNHTGIDRFVQAVKDMFFHGEVSVNDEIYLTSMRHKEAVREAYESMLQVRESLDRHMPEDFYSIDLMSACSSLGKITGEEAGEDLVNEIFSKFCVGK